MPCPLCEYEDLPGNSPISTTCRQAKMHARFANAPSSHKHKNLRFVDSLKQQAQDYALGTLPKEDAILFEALLEKDEDARNYLIEAQEDCANLSMTVPSSDAGDDLRSRVMESCRPKKDFNPFLDTAEINRLQENYLTPDQRYLGGGASVDMGDVGEQKIQDDLFQVYESLIELFPLVSGDSTAASGDFGSLGNWIGNGSLLSSHMKEALSHSLSNDEKDPGSRSTQRSLLAALPSLTFFINRVRENSATLADIRRIFYLCRDQLKIMRASFGDLDPSRLADDEKLRLHGAGLLRTKWWGAEHSYFSGNGNVRCGHFFDGPVTERCVEFAEYDSNLYCLANLLSSRTGNGEFHIELLKDAIPGGVLAVAMAETPMESHDEINSIVEGSQANGKIPLRDFALWKLIEDSMLRGHQGSGSDSMRDNPLHGCQRFENGTYLWFAWPNVPNTQEGAVADTGNPLQ